MLPRIVCGWALHILHAFVLGRFLPVLLQARCSYWGWASHGGAPGLVDRGAPALLPAHLLHFVTRV